MKKQNVAMGEIRYIYIDDIDFDGSVEASDFLINATASYLKQEGGVNWVPLIVSETSHNKYNVVGNSFIYAVV